MIEGIKINDPPDGFVEFTIEILKLIESKGVKNFMVFIEDPKDNLVSMCRTQNCQWDLDLLLLEVEDLKKTIAKRGS